MNQNSYNTEMVQVLLRNKDMIPNIKEEMGAALGQPTDNQIDKFFSQADIADLIQ